MNIVNEVNNVQGESIDANSNIKNNIPNEFNTNQNKNKDKDQYKDDQIINYVSSHDENLILFNYINNTNEENENQNDFKLTNLEKTEISTFKYTQKIQTPSCTKSNLRNHCTTEIIEFTDNNKVDMNKNKIEMENSSTKHFVIPEKISKYHKMNSLENQKEKEGIIIMKESINKKKIEKDNESIEVGFF